MLLASTFTVEVGIMAATAEYREMMRGNSSTKYY
jgi:hypothetical protein